MTKHAGSQQISLLDPNVKYQLQNAAESENNSLFSPLYIITELSSSSGNIILYQVLFVFQICRVRQSNGGMLIWDERQKAAYVKHEKQLYAIENESSLKVKVR